MEEALSRCAVFSFLKSVPCCVFVLFLQVLADIELAQTLKSETEKAQEEMIQTVPHPIDQDYNSLKCKLTLMEKNTEMFKVLSLT